jgi:hypothetical protein
MPGLVSGVGVDTGVDASAPAQLGPGFQLALARCHHVRAKALGGTDQEGAPDDPGGRTVRSRIGPKTLVVRSDSRRAAFLVLRLTR